MILQPRAGTKRRAAGLKVLRAVGQGIEAVCRAEDEAVRLQGDGEKVLYQTAEAGDLHLLRNGIHGVFFVRAKAL